MFKNKPPLPKKPAILPLKIKRSISINSKNEYQDEKLQISNSIDTGYQSRKISPLASQDITISPSVENNSIAESITTTTNEYAKLINDGDKIHLPRIQSLQDKNIPINDHLIGHKTKLDYRYSQRNKLYLYDKEFQSYQQFVEKYEILNVENKFDFQPFLKLVKRRDTGRESSGGPNFLMKIIPYHCENFTELISGSITQSSAGAIKRNLINQQFLASKTDYIVKIVDIFQTRSNSVTVTIPTAKSNSDQNSNNNSYNKIGHFYVIFELGAFNAKTLLDLPQFKNLNNLEKAKYTFTMFNHINKALETTHNYGFLHCDIKLENIIVFQNKNSNKITFKLTDFENFRFNEDCLINYENFKFFRRIDCLKSPEELRKAKAPYVKDLAKNVTLSRLDSEEHEKELDKWFYTSVENEPFKNVKNRDRLQLYLDESYQSKNNGKAIITEEYCSKEILKIISGKSKKSKLSTKSDFWALGVGCYKLYSNFYPFQYVDSRFLADSPKIYSKFSDHEKVQQKILKVEYYEVVNDIVSEQPGEDVCVLLNELFRALFEGDNTKRLELSALLPESKFQMIHRN